MADDDVIHLTTTGRVSKRPHRIEVWYARVGPRLYLLAGGGRESDWVRNLEVEARCTVAFGRTGADVGATGQVIPKGDPEDRTARDLVFEKYQERYAGDLTRWRDSALPIVLVLDEP